MSRAPALAPRTRPDVMGAPAPDDEDAGQPVYLRPEEVAERLRSSTDTLARWRSRGTGPAYIKPRGKVLYALSEIEAFEQAARRTSTRG